jgi:hypothetical protein
MESTIIIGFTRRNPPPGKPALYRFNFNLRQNGAAATGESR